MYIFIGKTFFYKFIKYSMITLSYLNILLLILDIKPLFSTLLLKFTFNLKMSEVSHGGPNKPINLIILHTMFCSQLKYWFMQVAPVMVVDAWEHVVT